MTLAAVERKFANHPVWPRILSSRYYQAVLDIPEFQGFVTLFCMDAVRAPLVVNNFDCSVTIVDAGYSWLQYFPTGEHYTVTAHFDADQQVGAWYIDMCLRTGVGDGNIPWMDDLFLDLLVSPEMEVAVKDADELLAARESGVISAAEYDLAWQTAERLMALVACRQFPLLGLAQAHRQMLLEKTQMTHP